MGNPWPARSPGGRTRRAATSARAGRAPSPQARNAAAPAPAAPRTIESGSSTRAAAPPAPPASAPCAPAGRARSRPASGRRSRRTRSPARGRLSRGECGRLEVAGQRGAGRVERHHDLVLPPQAPPTLCRSPAASQTKRRSSPSPRATSQTSSLKMRLRLAQRAGGHHLPLPQVGRGREARAARDDHGVLLARRCCGSWVTNA